MVSHRYQHNIHDVLAGDSWKKQHSKEQKLKASL